MFFLLCLGLAAPQVRGEGLNPVEIWAKIDSARRAEESRILTPEMRKGLRECGRSKMQWLKERRSADPEIARVDSALSAAKTGQADPRSDAIQALFEKKYRLEQHLDSLYTATPEGKSCAAREVKHRAAVEAELEKNERVRAWKEKLERYENGDPDWES